MCHLLDQIYCILTAAKKCKEDTDMKTTTIREYALNYPNAATRKQVMNKIVDLLLMAAVGAGLAAMLLLLLALA